MCGIAGYIDFRKVTEKETLVKMTKVLQHRGPDDSGYEYFSDNADIGFGFQRLSIIELSSLGHQPMVNDDTNYTIIFNGEIYNYKEVKKELEKKGHQFKSSSDTEVILKSYIQWGKECVQRFVGMFAIAIYDKIAQKITLFRDRAGVKPLFYYWKDDLFLFASELKSFHQHPDFKKEINFDALALYFQHLYIPAPYTIFKNTSKVEPGHLLEIYLKNKTLPKSKYWDVADAYNQPKLDISIEEAAEQTEQLLRSAFEYRMIADVPVGVFLSGGYDSSAVAALLQKDRIQKIKTFTIGFHEEKYNEAHYAKQVAEYLGTEHHEYYCTFKEAIDIVPSLPSVYDEPFADSSAIPTILVSRIAREHVTVALSADGGDEVFAGYHKRYLKSLKYIKTLQASPPLLKKSLQILTNGVSFFQNKDIATPDRLDKLKEILSISNPVKAFDIITQNMTFSEVSKLFNRKLTTLPTYFEEDKLLHSSNDTLNYLLATDYKTYLADDILQKVDRATMSVSLEGREPFLDHRIIEFIARLPSNYKLNEETGKLLLKKIVYIYLPKEIMDRPKMGFGIPVASWCRNELKEMLLYYLDDKKIRTQGIFNAQQVSIILKKYFEGKPVDFERVWCLFMFQMWYERWME